jgi:tetratricopeptide (TPR) repeat protein
MPLTEQVPLLLLWAMRTEQQSRSWQEKLAAESVYGHRYTEIVLRPLSQANSGELVDHLLANSELPHPLRTRILEKAEGNPFFLEEVLRTLIEDGIVVHDERSQLWRATGQGEAVDIPGNVQALLMARIDRLEASAKQTLQLASIIGRSFYYRVLAEVAGKGKALDSQLLTLERAELIREAGRIPELEYLFRHALTQVAAYSTILLKQRRTFHLQVGEALEVLFPEQRGELAGNLASHFYKARDYEKALQYYTVAGDGAFRLHASAEAVEHYSQAIICAEQVVASSHQLVHLYTRRGRSYELSSRYDEALANYHEMQRLAYETGDQALELASLAAQCIVRATQTPLYDPQEARNLAEQALPLSQELGDQAAEAKVLWGLLILESWGAGDRHKALAYGQHSLAIARELGLKEQMGFTLANLVAANITLKRLDAANEAANEARAIWLELGNTPMLADSYGLAGILRWSISDFEGAIAASHERIRISQSIGNEWNQAMGLSMLALANHKLGNFGSALESAEECLQIMRRSDNPNFGAYAHIAQTAVYLAAGDLQQAQKTGGHLYAVQDSITVFVRPMVAAARAQIHIRLGELEQAESTLDGILELADFEAMPANWAVFPHVAQVRLLLAMDDPEPALEKANFVISSLRQAGVKLLLADTLWLKAKAFIALGDWQQAHENLLTARALAEEAKDRQMLWHILASLIEVEKWRGNQASTRVLRTRAREIIDYIAAHAGSEELRLSFLSMPETQFILAPWS